MNTNAELKIIPIEWLQPCQYQVRTQFDEVQLEELASSIKAQGIIEPLIVRQLASQSYEIVAGERRWRASGRASLQEVPCIVRVLSDNVVREIVLIENLQRAELNPIEEANALSQLIEGNELSQAELARQIGKGEVYISQRLRLLKLSDKVRPLVISGELSAGHAVALISLPDYLQWQLAEQCSAKKWSVRQLEQRAKAARDATPAKTTLSSGNDADMKQLITTLSEHFGAKVSIKMHDKGQGDLVIHFNSSDEFEGILEKTGVNDAI